MFRVEVLVRVPGQAPIVTTRRARPLDLPPGLRQFVRRRCSSPTRLHSRVLSALSPSSALLSSLLSHSTLVTVITASMVSAASIYRSIPPQGGTGVGQLKFDPSIVLLTIPRLAALL
ncbi:hypothetical protein T01_10232 [Trichinella spiralis]|uniref:Uncharacterized protein n=1 Tax=Trichinella spiralis TaxID=6334 RepID=A0A0V1B180_TRISP|nr:hypothetical protein T01_10232 [Trichinella spiralis]